MREHLVAWRLGWSLWIAAAFSLLWFYTWWRARVAAAPTARLAIAVAAAALLADVSAELLLIVAAPTAYAATAPLAFLLTGGVANGLYTVAGALLTLATPLARAERAWAWTMWGAGALLSAGAFLELPLLTAAATGVLFALFCPWCLYLAWKLR